MTDLLDGLGGADLATRALVCALLLGARIAPPVLLAPWLGLRHTPMTMRIAVILALVLALCPIALSHASTLPEHLIDLGIAATRELSMGLIFGVVIAIPFFALDHAGRIIDGLRESSPADSAVFDESSSPLANLYLLFGATLFLLLGGHRMVIAALADGLKTLPLGSPVDAASAQSLALGSARIIVHALELGISFAAPAITTLLLLTATLGIIERTAPTLPTFFLGMPLRAALGIATVLLSLSMLVPHLTEIMRDSVWVASELVFRVGF